MALTVTTNLSSLIVQNNLKKATTSLDKAIERMTTGYKINHAKDNAAGYSIATDWETKLSSIDVASENAEMGLNLLQTAEENYGLISTHLQRIRDLTEQSANGTYGSDSLKAISREIQARLDEIDRVSNSAEYNGIELMKGNGTAINLQVGITSTTSNSQISLAAELFKGATTKNLVKKSDGGEASANSDIAKDCTGVDSSGTYTAANNKASNMLAKIDAAISEVSTRVTKIGAAQNRVESAVETLSTQSQNITSSLSTLRDTDVSKESSNYIRAQILQQASATLLATANQSPSIALNLI